MQPEKVHMDASPVKALAFVGMTIILLASSNGKVTDKCAVTITASPYSL